MVGFQNKIIYEIYQSSKRYSVCFLCMHSMRVDFRRKMGLWVSGDVGFDVRVSGKTA